MFGHHQKLLELNNIHSLKAVVAGLQSAAVYRLSQTWKLVPKKEKAAFDKFEEFLAETDNRCAPTCIDHECVHEGQLLKVHVPVANGGQLYILLCVLKGLCI